MSNDLIPDPKRNIENALRKIAQNSQHLPSIPQQSDMPLLQGEAPRTFGQKFKGVLKYMFAGNK